MKAFNRHSYRDSKGRFTKAPAVPTYAPAMPLRLIKSAIYRANDRLARFTGEYDSSNAPIFSQHGTRYASVSVHTISREEVREYLTPVDNSYEGAMEQ